MVPLEIEVGYCEESEVNIGDPTQSLLRVHTDDCACRSTMELGNHDLFIFFMLSKDNLKNRDVKAFCLTRSNTKKQSSAIILFCFVLFYIILFYFIHIYFILFYFILFLILFYFILFYFILFYFILFYFILFYFNFNFKFSCLQVFLLYRVVHSGCMFMT